MKDFEILEMNQRLALFVVWPGISSVSNLGKADCSLFEDVSAILKIVFLCYNNLSVKPSLFLKTKKKVCFQHYLNVEIANLYNLFFLGAKHAEPLFRCLSSFSCLFDNFNLPFLCCSFFSCSMLLQGPYPSCCLCKHFCSLSHLPELLFSTASPPFSGNTNSYTHSAYIILCNLSLLPSNFS